MTVELKMAAFESLLSEVSSALAELVECAQTNESLADKVATALSKLSVVLDRPGSNSDAVVAAIKGLQFDAPVVKFEPKFEPKFAPSFAPALTLPAPTVETVIMPAALVDYEMRVDYDKDGRIKTARLTASPHRSTKALAL